MTNTQNAPIAGPGITLTGGAAILAPVTAFQNGVVPPNALVLLPINPNGTPIEKEILKGPVALDRPSHRDPDPACDRVAGTAIHPG